MTGGKVHHFEIVSKFKPAGSQSAAIESLSNGIKKGKSPQTLLGVTGSGKSLDYSEQIIIRDSFGRIQKFLIGDFVEKYVSGKKKFSNESIAFNVRGNKILSFDLCTKKISESEIIQVSRHKEEYVYEILLDDYSQIKVTKDHNCFRLVNTDFELCSTSDLKIGDYLPTSNEFFNNYSGLNFINLLDFNPSAKIAIDLLIKKFRLSDTLLLKLLKNEHHSPKWKLGQILSKTNERSVSQSTLDKIIVAKSLDYEASLKNLKLVDKKGQDFLSPLIELNTDFLRFIGLYIAEGHTEKNYIIISNSDTNLKSACLSFWKKQGLGFVIRNNCDIQYNSVCFSNFFKEFGKNAQSKRIPSFLYNLSDSQFAVVLRAMFDGDGWIEPKKGVYYSSASKELIFDVKNILLRFGISSRINEKYNKIYGCIYYTLKITGKQNLILFKKKINFSIFHKKQKLGGLAKSYENTNVDLIPNSKGFFKKILFDNDLSQKDLSKIIGCERSYISMLQSGKRSISKRKFRVLIKWLEKKNVKYSVLKNLLSYNFRKIVSIKKKKSQTGFVYDLSVKNNENFTAGYGNVFVHNTFTIANVIQNVQKKTLVLAHNKTLAAQLYNEFKSFFPKNRVEYFVSFYDYYQPESYIPSTDQYIEKDSQINDYIERMRLSATTSLLSRNDVIVVASVSCIYGLGNPKNYEGMGFEIEEGMNLSRKELMSKLLDAQYERNDLELLSGRFRVKGDVIDIVPGYDRNILRVELNGNEIERIVILNKDTNAVEQKITHYHLFPARHFVTPKSETLSAIESIKKELEERLPNLGMIEAHRLKQRTNYDLELLKTMGFCKGIENYSRHFEGRKEGEKPYCLLDYFGDDFLIVIDESHQSIPQLNGMYNGDRQRKQTLIDYGFRLPSALDNRPLKFSEFEEYMKKENVIFVSATPDKYERANSKNFVEQIIRPTGLVDPIVEVRGTKNQIEDVLKEIKRVTDEGNRVLVTALTKKLAEEMADFFASKNIKSRYLHSEIKTLERTEIIRQLREGKFDVLVGINLLREGIDIPEVGLVAIFDADKEGFLRDQKSLIQIIGRAARNSDSKVILYADKKTDSMNRAIIETNRRRELQLAYNKKNNITPITIKKPIGEQQLVLKDTKHIPNKERERLVSQLEVEMRDAANRLDFEFAIALRDQINALRKELSLKKGKEK